MDANGIFKSKILPWNLPGALFLLSPHKRTACTLLYVEGINKKNYSLTHIRWNVFRNKRKNKKKRQIEREKTCSRQWCFLCQCPQITLYPCEMKFSTGGTTSSAHGKCLQQIPRAQSDLMNPTSPGGSTNPPWHRWASPTWAWWSTRCHLQPPAGSLLGWAGWWAPRRGRWLWSTQPARGTEKGSQRVRGQEGRCESHYCLKNAITQAQRQQAGDKLKKPSVISLEI